jgi:hypothetical protein
MVSRGLLISFCTWLAAACGSGPGEQLDCADGTDNDADGLIDDLDPGCALNDGLNEAPDPPRCDNGIDDDGDGFVDLLDVGCEGDLDDDEEDPTRACNDLADNDEDGLIDQADPGCDAPLDDDEFNPPQCMDLVDNDGDVRIDHPFDPGCEAPEDEDEVNVGFTECSDELDNDGDELTDYPLDPGCSSAADLAEFNVTGEGICGPSVEVADITTSHQATGSITGARPNELESPVCRGFGAEFAYTYDVGPTTGTKALVISTDHPETTLDTVIYVRTECTDAATELACDDDGGVRPRTSLLTVPDATEGTYYIVVDAYGPSSLGSFKLTVVERNGLHSPCSPADPTSCAPGLLCQPILPGSPNTCEHPRCSDEVDNDADDLVDHPEDPGCADLADNNEVG